MKNQIFSSFFKMPAIMCFTLSIGLMGCENQDELSPDALKANEASEIRTSTTHTHYGPATPLGKGVAKAWTQTTKSGEPLAMGVTISAKAAANLPHEMTEYKLALPKTAAFEPFNTVTLDWGPMGHAPEGVYNLPHFDIHFYMISDEERMMIAPGPQAVFPDSKYLPADYVTDGFSVPMMGVHWNYKFAPEWMGQVFTKTMMFGSYMQNVIFYEPMITLQYLQSLAPNQTVITEIPQPSQVQKSGYYPTHYSITYNPTPGEYIIALTGMSFRQAQ